LRRAGEGDLPKPDPGWVQLAARERISGLETNLLLGFADGNGSSGSMFWSWGNRIRARTARRWLKRLGLRYDKVAKDVYVDGHERTDVVEHREKVFIPRWKDLQRRVVVFLKRWFLGTTSR